MHKESFLVNANIQTQLHNQIHLLRDSCQTRKRCLSLPITSQYIPTETNHIHISIYMKPLLNNWTQLMALGQDYTRETIGNHVRETLNGKHYQCSQRKSNHFRTNRNNDSVPLRCPIKCVIQRIKFAILRLHSTAIYILYIFKYIMQFQRYLLSTDTVLSRKYSHHHLEALEDKLSIS